MIENESFLRKPCVFPFIYKNRTFKGCSELDTTDPWCSTELDKNGFHSEGHWGNCPTECRIDGRGTLLTENGKTNQLLY